MQILRLNKIAGTAPTRFRVVLKDSKGRETLFGTEEDIRGALVKAGVSVMLVKIVRAESLRGDSKSTKLSRKIAPDRSGRPLQRWDVFKQLIVVLLIFPVSILLRAQSPETSPVELAAGDIFRMASPSVVLIEDIGEDGNPTGRGSGFLVTSDGRILTAFHVIAHTKHARVTLANHDVYDPVWVLDVDRDRDIAFLKIKAVNLPYLKLGHSASVQVGSKLYALGTPLGLENTLSEGLLSGIRQLDYKLFQLSAPISPGSSGGPVLTAQGEVIGIVEGLIPAGQNLNFAIPIDYATVLLDSRELRPLAYFYTPEPTQPPPPQPKQEEPPVTPTASIEHDPISYVSSKIGLWTKEDAEVELGKPFARRDGVTGGVVCCDIFRYYSPAPNFSSVELSIHRGNSDLRRQQATPTGGNSAEIDCCGLTRGLALADSSQLTNDRWKMVFGTLSNITVLYSG